MTKRAKPSKIRRARFRVPNSRKALARLSNRRCLEERFSDPEKTDLPHHQPDSLEEKLPNNMSSAAFDASARVSSYLAHLEKLLRENTEYSSSVPETLTQPTTPFMQEYYMLSYITKSTKYAKAPALLNQAMHELTDKLESTTVEQRIGYLKNAVPWIIAIASYYELANHTTVKVDVVRQKVDEFKSNISLILKGIYSGSP